MLASFSFECFTLQMEMEIKFNYFVIQLEQGLIDNDVKAAVKVAEILNYERSKKSSQSFHEKLKKFD